MRDIGMLQMGGTGWGYCTARINSSLPALLFLCIEILVIDPRFPGRSGLRARPRRKVYSESR